MWNINCSHIFHSTFSVCEYIFRAPGPFFFHPKKKHQCVVNTLLEPTNRITAWKIMTSIPTQVDQNETLSDDVVLIVGGGPVGLLVASVLAFYGVKSLLLERNKTTTKLVQVYREEYEKSTKRYKYDKMAKDGSDQRPFHGNISKTWLG